jgi:hypothetical protein
LRDTDTYSAVALTAGEADDEVELSSDTEKPSYMQWKLVWGDPAVEKEYTSIMFDSDETPTWRGFSYVEEWDEDNSRWDIYAIWAGDSDTGGVQVALEETTTPPVWDTTPDDLGEAFYGKTFAGNLNPRETKYLHARLNDGATPIGSYSLSRYLPVKGSNVSGWEDALESTTSPNVALWVEPGPDSAKLIMLYSPAVAKLYFVVRQPRPYSILDPDSLTQYLLKTDDPDVLSSTVVYIGGTPAYYTWHGLRTSTEYFAIARGETAEGRLGSQYGPVFFRTTRYDNVETSLAAVITVAPTLTVMNLVTIDDSVQPSDDVSSDIEPDSADSAATSASVSSLDLVTIDDTLTATTRVAYSIPD